MKTANNIQSRSIPAITGLVAGTFTLDGLTFYSGLYNSSVEWNGFVVPYFTEDVALRVLAEVMGHGRRTAIDPLLGVVLYDDVDAFKVEWSYSASMCGDDLVYSIGGYQWCWQLL